MALMYPQQPSVETKSNAERKVFHALKDQLSDEYTVLHSLPVYKRTKKNGPLRDGEIDFLILHPAKGMLGVEVKGGGIEVNGDTGCWTTTNFEGLKSKIKNPYEQIKEHIHTLAKEVANHSNLLRFSFPYGHAVWFPDLDLSGLNLGLSVELKGVTLDNSDLKRISNAVSQLFKNSIGLKPRNVPGQVGVKEFRKFYAPSKKINISLARKISVEKVEFFEATKSQYKILSLIERFNRVAISGVAGSGKTFLALEKARRILEIDPEKRILIVCYNKVLAKFLRSISPFPNNITIQHFHGLCSLFCNKANVELPQPDPQVRMSGYFENVLPDSLLDSLYLVDDRYDALIVDEGQDFHGTWWLPLQELLDDPEEGMFYIFFDDNQTLYGKQDKYPLDVPPISLSENCRNTRQIYNEVMRYYKGEIDPNPLGPEGRTPEFVAIVSNEMEPEAVAEILKRLTKKEKVSVQDITILTPFKEHKSKWKTGNVLANHSITWDIDDPGRQSKIFCSTIHSFKGLESPIVFLTETSGILHSKKNELRYVATSRANSHLVVFEST